MSTNKVIILLLFLTYYILLAGCSSQNENKPPEESSVSQPAKTNILSDEEEFGRFLKKSAVEFTKRNQSVTYLVFNIGSMGLVGYFTLALKPLTVR